MPGNRYGAALDPPQGAMPPPQMPPQDAAPPQGTPPVPSPPSGASTEGDTNDPNHPDVQKLFMLLRPYILAVQQQDPQHFQQLMQEHGVDPAMVAQLLQSGPDQSSTRDDAGRPAPHWLAQG